MAFPSDAVASPSSDFMGVWSQILQKCGLICALSFWVMSVHCILVSFILAELFMCQSHCSYLLWQQLPYVMSPQNCDFMRPKALFTEPAKPTFCTLYPRLSGVHPLYLSVPIFKSFCSFVSLHFCLQWLFTPPQLKGFLFSPSDIALFLFLIFQTLSVKQKPSPSYFLKLFSSQSFQKCLCLSVLLVLYII